MKILQVNTAVNIGSTGRIAEDIGKMLISEGHDSFIGYGRGPGNSSSRLVKVGNKNDYILHTLKSRIFDLHGFGSKDSTKKFVKEIEQINPDLIHMHNLHGYFLNIEVFFRFLKQLNKPVVWTFHDCWPFTGHCSYFDKYNCYKWENQCYDCPNINGYPESWIIDNSRDNYLRKKTLFCDFKNIKIISPSQWLADHIKKSFLREYDVRVINNGIDLERFCPSGNINERINKRYILGVSNIWSQRKGLEDFIKLRSLITKDIDIVLVGISKAISKTLPDGIRGIERTESIEELAWLFSGAEVFINPTYIDNFPTVNIEALACGTPVITYNTGGSPESVDEKTGIIVRKGDLQSLAEAIKKILNIGKIEYSDECRVRALRLYDKNHKYLEYIKIYKDLIGN